MRVGTTIGTTYLLPNKNIHPVTPSLTYWPFSSFTLYMKGYYVYYILFIIDSPVPVYIYY